ncbi:STAS domain-containing protein [candidate division KSB1 bacterium]|nr:STAS domain-containing protein [candidate division KSB1 bacterium]
MYKTIKVHKKNSVTVVEVLERRIYLMVTEIFKEELLSVIEQGNHNLVIDLKNVAVMNSAGLGVLILSRDILTKKQGIIKLSNLQSLMHEIFSRMKLDTIFELYATPEDALASF